MSPVLTPHSTCGRLSPRLSGASPPTLSAPLGHRVVASRNRSHPPDREEKPASAPLDLIHFAVVRLLVGAPAQDSSPVAEMPVGDVIGTDFDDQL